MIRHLRISNFAIIENVDIDLYDGLNIITGETGAGKSIVIEAVSLALGSRADTAFVRSGKEKATIQMIADLNGEEYIITREISAGGRSTCRINDEIVTLGTLSSFCAGLADIHGQYDHQSLLNPDNHLTLVDLYRKDVISPAKEEVSRIFGEYSDLKSRLASLKADLAEGRRRLDFMSYELKDRQVDAARTLFKEKTLPKEIEDYRPPVNMQELLGDANLGKLQELFKMVMRRQEDKIDPVRSTFGQIEKDEVDMDAKTAYIEQYIHTHKTFSFRELLEKQHSRMEIIVTFLVMLEMMKTGRISIVQEDIFEDILITSNEG